MAGSSSGLISGEARAALGEAIMAGSSSGPISGEARAALGEAIRLVFARWTELQVAVENQWGGPDSCAKANQLGESVLSWFSCSGTHYSEDLVDMMQDKLLKSFYADLDDNSVMHVADQLSYIYLRCLQNDYSPIERLKNSHVQGNDVSQSTQIMAQETAADANPAPNAVPPINDDDNTSIDSNPAPDSDGWTVPHRRRGRRAN